MELQSLIVKDSIRIVDALKAIEMNSKGILFLCNNRGILQGVITDGDIRRALLAGAGLNDSVKTFMKKNFVYARADESQKEIYNKFGSEIGVIPILDEKGRVTDYAEFREGVRIPLAQPQLGGNEYKYLMDAFLSTWISSTGEYISKFEKSFSAYCGMEYGVSTSNGTTALHLALVALGIGDGDEVIVPDLTFAATINAVLYTGAKPVIVDIEEDSWCISIEKAERYISPRTKAIIPVHLYGQPCNMDDVIGFARKYNLYIVEDCAEAHGAEWNGKKVGSFGDISCFSFFGNKVITTGEGGMCLTDDSDLSDKMRRLRDHGMSKERRYFHDVVGFNYRMTNMQAAIGTAQVERIDCILEQRKRIEDNYFDSLSDLQRISFQKRDLPQRKKIAWLVSALIEENERDLLIDRMKENNIDVRPFFYPLSDMPLYERYATDCCVSKAISKRGINFPTNTGVDSNVIGKIREIVLSI